LSWKKVAYLDEVATLSDTPPENVKVQTADEGDGTAASRDDHLHDIDVDVPAAVTVGASQGEGSSTSLARADHVHETPSVWTPDDHATTHKNAGGDEILLHEFGEPTSSVEFNKQQLLNTVAHTATSAPGTPVDGQFYYNSTDDHIYVYVAA
jgi:hypothetical protein